MQRALALPTVAVALLLLTSCTPSSGDDAPTAPPSASADAPIFESEDEALAAADATITDYWRIANAVLQAGGEGVERFEQIVTPRRMEAERGTAEVLEREGFYQVGNFEVEPATFQQMLGSPAGKRLIVTVCVDYSDVRMVNSDGLEAERSNTSPRITHQVELHSVSDQDPLSLKLDKSDPWPGSPC
ncbi:hypothetical protein FVA74_11070 [Salinibacterium sp. dk2585]|uniref:hypothetical protein n=1 Tax=unclassified Salinibacterium TaxID=2632331 RepID=UPI0011C24C11|nr:MULTISPECIES: hypothetical protein [unclassified Salinibacterium]QEE62046.1 hypothetical protein FVA74_11070 [Salinibacterium sp. dk2585]TXK52208.1 hypothetical protein FVP63_13355 [Salinibacterium sp. dk5596]